jgi:hypothetical protein
VEALGRIHWQMYLVGFAKIVQDTRRYPAVGFSLNLFPFGFGFMVLWVEPRILQTRLFFLGGRFTLQMHLIIPPFITTVAGSSIFNDCWRERVNQILSNLQL